MVSFRGARRLLSVRSGQGTVEYMMYIAVVVVGIAVAAYAFVGPFDAGYQGMKSDAQQVFQGAQQAGSGEQR